MATQRLSAELQIDAGLGASFTRAFDKLDARVNASTRKLRNIGQGAFDKFSIRNATRQLDRATQQMDNAFMRVFRNFKSATDSAFSYLRRKFMAQDSQVIDVGVRSPVLERGPPDGRGDPSPTSALAVTGAGFAISAFQRVPHIFADTNVQLKRQAKNFEALARHAGSMEKAVSPGLQKIDRVNRELAVQEKRIDHLRMARTRLNRAERQFNKSRSRVDPLGATGGYALARGTETYSNLDQVFRVLQTEDVAAHDIPLIREQVFRLAETTQFTDVEIANVLVGMKKDGQAVSAELTGVADSLKVAVDEINTTGTDLANAIKLQEQMSNATSVSALNMEQPQYIAGQSPSIYKGTAAFDSADFLAVSGALEGILRPERISTGLLADAAAGNLSAPRQEAFDLLNINIKDEEGKLKDAVSILQEFERAFNRPAFLDKQGQRMGDKVQPILAQIFGREALPTVANLPVKSDNTPGTLDRKAKVMEQSIDAAVNRLKSAVSVLSQRFFEALDGDGNFNRIVDGMSMKVQQLSAWLTENRASIESAFKSFVHVAGQIASASAAVFGQLFAYLRDRGPQIRAFFKHIMPADGQGVWNTLKPVVMGVLTLLREFVEVVSRLAAGNTKLLAWLASAYVGWKALQIPILAVNAGYNSVLGTVHKLSAAYAGMRMPQTIAPPIMKGAAPAPVMQTVTQKVTGTPILFLGKIRPLLAKIGRWLAPILLKVAALGPAFAKVGTFIAPLVTKIVAIGPAFLKIGGFISPVLAKLAAIGPAILAVLGGITAPVAAIIAAVVATVAGGVALVIANWDKAKAAFWSTVETIQLVGQVIWEGLQWVGRRIWDFLMNTGPNVQSVVSAMGTHIFSTFKGVGDWLIQYLGPVGQFIVNIFSSVGAGVAWAATGIWNGLKAIGTGIGRFFKGIFGSIVDGIVSMVQWLKKKVGDFFEGAVHINEKVQGVLRRIRDFFRKDKEQSIAAKIDLDVAVPTIPRQVVAADVQFTPIMPMETAQEFYLRAPDEMNEVHFNPPVGEVAVQTPPELKMPQMPELSIPQTPELETPAAPELQTPAVPILETPAAPELSIPQTPELEMPAAPELQTPAAPILETPAVPILETPAAPEWQTPYSPSPTTVEYVDFASVDEIDQTLKAGFKSLLHVNSAMLDAIKGKHWTTVLQESGVPDRVSVHIMPEKKGTAAIEQVRREVFEKTEKIEQVKREVFKHIMPVVIDAPRVQIPDSETRYPSVAIPETQDIRMDTPTVAIPEMQDIGMDAPTVAIPETETLRFDAPTVAIPEMQDIGMDAPVVSVPEMQDIGMDAPTLTIPEMEPFQIDAPIFERTGDKSPYYEPLKIEQSSVLAPPVVSIPEMQDIRMDTPTVIIPETQDLHFDAPTVTIPEMQDIGMDAPTVAIPEIETLHFDAPTVAIPEMELPNIESPFSPFSMHIMPMEATGLPELERERAETVTVVPIQGKAEKESHPHPEQRVEITNNITIHQQPGEDAEMLTARILRELERKHRTEAYQ